MDGAQVRQLAIDLLCGSEKIRHALEADVPVEDIERSWRDELTSFGERARRHHLYD